VSGKTIGKERWREIRGVCPVCDRRGWCRASPDGAVVACRRNEFGAVRTVTYHDGSHAYLHRLDGETGPCPVAAAPVDVPRADDADLHRVYQALLARLSLNQRHRQQLQARGLSGEDVKRNEYHTLPAQCRAGVLRSLRELFDDSLLLSVPGVVVKDGPHGKYLTLAGLPGLLVPVRSVAGHVVGLVVRPDDPGDGGKYRWLSSRHAGGPSPGQRVHVPVGAQGGARVVLVEGILKADVAFCLAGRKTAVVGLPGPWVTGEAINTVRQLKTSEVLLALDTDTVSNPHVAEAQLEGLYRLKGAGFAEGLLRWPPELGKGLDDALLAWRREGGAA
jgi:hypothetical protein